MKMVSAAKLKGDENRLKVAAPFNAWTHSLVAEPKIADDSDFADLPQKILLVPFTSEKGLCGGINSFITRGVRRMSAAMQDQGKEMDIVIVGEKGRSQLRRLYGEQIVRSVTDIVAPGTFALATGVAEEVNSAYAEGDYDAIVMLYNHYINPAVYDQMYQVIQELPKEGEVGEPLMEYEFDGDKKEVMADMHEYMIASQAYNSYLDGAAAEQAARMAAMSNATKNAGEMIDSLTLKYNRARQSRITTELIEIISGASALDDK